jgi:hypothetical protein
VPTPSADWPPDLDSGGIFGSTDKLVVTDLSSYTAVPRKLGTEPGNANFNVRWDIAPGPGLFAGWLNVGDLSAMTSAVAAGSPPMFSGVKAFNSGIACTAHPTFGPGRLTNMRSTLNKR